jgi:hypothetical protein
VIDMTGLKGTYTFTLDASNYVPPPPAPGQPREQEDEGYMVIRAIQEQLGLHLDRAIGRSTRRHAKSLLEYGGIGRRVAQIGSRRLWQG